MEYRRNRLIGRIEANWSGLPNHATVAPALIIRRSTASVSEIMPSTHRGNRPDAAGRSGERASQIARREEIRDSEMGTVPG